MANWSRAKPTSPGRRGGLFPSVKGTTTCGRKGRKARSWRALVPPLVGAKQITVVSQPPRHIGWVGVPKA